MALQFDMGSSDYEKMAQVQARSLANRQMGENIGTGLAAAGDRVHKLATGQIGKGWTGLGKKYSKYLQQDFAEGVLPDSWETFKNREKPIHKASKLRARIGDESGLNEAFGQFLMTDESADYKNEDGITPTRDAFARWMETDEARGILKGHRKEKRGEFFDSAKENITNFGKGALKYGGGALGVAAGIAAPPLALTAGLGYGMSKLPGVDKRAEGKAGRQARREEREAFELEARQNRAKAVQQEWQEREAMAQSMTASRNQLGSSGAYTNLGSSSSTNPLSTNPLANSYVIPNTTYPTAPVTLGKKGVSRAATGATQYQTKTPSPLQLHLQQNNPSYLTKNMPTLSDNEKRQNAVNAGYSRGAFNPRPPISREEDFDFEEYNLDDGKTIADKDYGGYLQSLINMQKQIDQQNQEPDLFGSGYNYNTPPMRKSMGYRGK